MSHYSFKWKLATPVCAFHTLISGNDPAALVRLAAQQTLLPGGYNNNEKQAVVAQQLKTALRARWLEMETSRQRGNLASNAD